jgi:uncharacterized cofD-like protein
MAGITQDFAEAVRLTSEVLAIKGVIYPATNSNVTLRAEFADGSTVEGETRITASRKKIRRISLNPVNTQPLDVALNAIAKADLISIGPGSLYTSLVPNLLVDNIVDAIERSAAKKIYIQNIMTQPGESDDMSAADHVEAMVCHSQGKLLFSRILLNNAIPSAAMLRKYELEGATLVANDKKRLRSMGLECVEADLLAKGRVIRHDPDKLARVLYAMLGV